MNNSWFTTQIDRDFKTGFYGDGIRFHNNPHNVYDYEIIIGVSYNQETNVLIVKNSSDEEITISFEPETQLFKKIIYEDWKEWDEKYGKLDEDRTDYKPLCHNSIKSLAKELGIYDNEKMNYKNMYI